MPDRTTPRRTNDSAIARLRIERGLTQAQLAEKIGVYPRQIGSWETGARNPKLDALKKIAVALGCSLSDLTDI